ncbi:MAG: chain-length determining protein [Prevotellaceae bacterium]|jgi:uncharacterized protein involved in exopolysaccharide biosynthesis|nr:chain-length determining protein [Prevotellaceae bacterium]
MDNQEKYEDEIDLMAILNKLKASKRFIIKVSIIGFIAGIVIAFSIPKEYTTSVILAQSTASDKAGNLGALASMAGIDLQQNSGELSPVLYPDILASTPFMLGLFDIMVADKEQEIDTTLYDYLLNHQKGAWWGYVMGAPGQLLSLIRGTETEEGEASSEKSTIIVLTKEQEEILGGLKSRINIAVDKKTGLATIEITMQSPAISAKIADTVISYMQSYIVNYRTEKARQNLEYIEKLYDEAKLTYFDAQQEYAKAVDRNQSVVSANYQATTLTRLQNEMNLAFGIYNQTAQQLQLAKIKVQDTKPVCVIIQPAVVPSHPAKPKKKIILAGFVFMAFAGACGWVYLKDMLSQKKESTEETV